MSVNRTFFYCFAVETLSEDEDEIIEGCAESVSVSSTQPYKCSSDFSPTPGGPFSALTPSMWPQDIMVKLGNPVSDQKNPASASMFS